MPRVLLLVVLSLLAAHSMVRAQTAGDDAQGRSHFTAGLGLYQLGRYDEALREFSSGYALTHRTEFLINIGQCYRALGQLAKAREALGQFLVEAAPDHPRRSAVEELISEIDRETPSVTAKPPIAAPAAPAPVAPPTTVAAPPRVATVTPTALTAGQVAAAHATPSRRWPWILAAALTVAAAVAVALAVALVPRNASPRMGSEGNLVIP